MKNWMGAPIQEVDRLLYLGSAGFPTPESSRPALITSASQHRQHPFLSGLQPLRQLKQRIKMHPTIDDNTAVQ